MNRVVVIDDDDIFLFLCSKAFENLGFTKDLKKFTDSKKGLAYLLDEVSDDEYPTMLMVDINMPVVDGWEIIEALEKKNPQQLKKCKTFILSSSIDVKDKEKALSYSSVSGFIIKPLSETHLKNIAKEYFGLT